MKLVLNPVETAKVAIVVSRFNEPVSMKLLEGAEAELKKTLSGDDIVIIFVPGAGEIPLVAKQLAQQNKYDAIIALGAVIRGETTHYESVCDRVTFGCQQVMLDYNIPVIQSVLTTENAEQAFDRIGGKHGHKGVEAAHVALEMIAISRALMQSTVAEPV